MSEETGPRCTWYMRPDEKRMDVIVAHRDGFAVMNAMLSISRAYGGVAVIWAEPYKHVGQIIANGMVDLRSAQGAHARGSLPRYARFR